MKEKLKIGVIFNSHIIPSWEYQIIKVLNDSDYAEIVLVIINKEDKLTTQKNKKPSPHRLLRLLDKTDRIIFSRKIKYDLKKDINELLHNVPQIESGTLPGHTDELTKFELDIVLRFGSDSIDADILKKVKYGILAYTIDNGKELNSINPGFWEVVQRIDVTNTSLVISTPDSEKESVIFSSWESTCPFSININRNNIHWRNALFMPRIIKRIFKDGSNFLDRQRSNSGFAIADAQLDGQSDSLVGELKYVVNFLSAAFSTVYRKLMYNDDFNWDLLIDISQGSNNHSYEFGNFRKIHSPKGIFWADPFVVKENDYYYLFVEEYIYKKHKAHISVLKLDNKGTLLSSDKIIENKYHMSYPFVFKLEDMYYMIPETSKNKTIELYKSTNFPYEWKFERNIMEDISAVDTTLFFFNNKWWLFTSVDQTCNKSGSSTELFLYFTDNIFSGKWESHPANPIVSDVRSARPAGKMFIQDGIIYRPSQDCSGRYGRAFNINKVTKLTETEYNETVHVKIGPAWDKKLSGTHTFNFDQDFTVIDVYSFRKRLEN